MKSRIKLIFFFLISFLLPMENNSFTGNAQGLCCGKMIKAFDFIDWGDPVITGQPIEIPTLKLRVTDNKTGEAVPRKEVIIRYVWSWYRYPYPEHRFGVWSNSFDVIHYLTDEDGYFLLPAYKLVPRGWYKGKYLFGRKPKFRDIELSVENLHFWMTRKQIEKTKKLKTTKSIFLSRHTSFQGPFRIEVFAQADANLH